MKGYKKIRVNRQKIIDAVKGMSLRLIEDLEGGELDTVFLEDGEDFIKISVTNKVVGAAFLFAALASEYAEEVEEDEKCTPS